MRVQCQSTDAKADVLAILVTTGVGWDSRDGNAVTAVSMPSKSSVHLTRCSVPSGMRKTALKSERLVDQQQSASWATVQS